MEWDDEDDDSPEMSDEEFAKCRVNLDAVVVCDKYLLSTRVLAAQLKINPYITLGEYFKNLSDQDVFYLSDKVDKDDYEEIVLLSEMLSLAEGSGSENLEQARSNASTFAVLVLCTSLYRKGLVELDYSSMTFDEQYGDRMVVRRKDD